MSFGLGKMLGKAMILISIVLVVAILMVGLVTSTQGSADAAACGPEGGEALSADVQGVDPITPYSRDAMGRAAVIMRVGRDLGVPFRGQLIAVMTAMQESTLGDSASSRVPNADHDAGPFQQRVITPGVSGAYGTLAEVNNVSWAAKTFYKGVLEKNGSGIATGHHIPGLSDIPGWERMPLTVAAQRVQRSAYPEAYAKHEAKARAIMSALSGVNVQVDPTQPGSAVCAGTKPGSGVDLSGVSGTVAGAIQAGQSTIGVRYLLGAGGPSGPTSGAQDCSGLTSFSYAKVGVTLPRSARAQWARLRSNQVQVADIRPGDLIFEAWGNRLQRGVVSHVGIYLGGGKMLEASESAGRTRVSPARLSGPQFVGIARVIP
ncbi:C40 family peptidase [Devriesea agamarum]|uniref:C40 family peptidase n=1 Tax=Devriesea agamarum TaxID=472569 RepID=UPI00071E1686|nr:C40 family peptidase [Devriesea agamarum]